MTRHPFSISRLLGFSLILCIGVSAVTRTEAFENRKSTIFVIRGGGGYFPNLGTVVRQKFEASGLKTVDFRYNERGGAAKKIAAAYRAGQLPRGIVLVGYSLGGCGVLEVSRELQKEGIPIRMLVLIETLNKAQTVPANVKECFNLYHVPAFLGTAVRAESSSTKLTNYEAYSDGGLGLEYSHFTMPFVEEVHELIASKIVKAISTPDRRSIAPSRTGAQGRENPASAPVGKRNNPGMFSRTATISR